MYTNSYNNQDGDNNIITFDGIPDDSSQSTAHYNAKLLNSTLQSLSNSPNTIFIISGTYHTLGGIVVSNLVDITIILNGELFFYPDITNWPRTAKPDNHNRIVIDCLYFISPTNLILTSYSRGTLNGNGPHWWHVPAVGYLLHTEDRPRLLQIYGGVDTLLEHWLFLDSPYWSTYFPRSRGLEVRYCGVLSRRTDRDGHSMEDLSAFNTDGFDVSGRDVYIHDVNVWCQDDAITVKDGSSHMLFERVNASGMGIVVGSIGNSIVSNITFRDFYLHRPFKGIYLKFRQITSGYNYGAIQNVLIENVLMERPTMPIWIGPAQQSDSRNPCLANPCSICWPVIPWAKCDGIENGYFENITLKNIVINRPVKKSVLIGHPLNEMRNVIFDSVRVQHCRNRNYYDVFDFEDSFPLLPLDMGFGARADSYVMLLRLAIAFAVTVLLALSPLWGFIFTFSYGGCNSSEKAATDDNKAGRTTTTTFGTWMDIVKIVVIILFLSLLPVIYMSYYLSRQTATMVARESSSYNYDGYLKCENVEGLAMGTTYPVPYCFDDVGVTNDSLCGADDDCCYLSHEMSNGVLFSKTCTFAVLFFVFGYVSRLRFKISNSGLDSDDKHHVQHNDDDDDDNRSRSNTNYVHFDN